MNGMPGSQPFVAIIDASAKKDQSTERASKGVALYAPDGKFLWSCVKKTLYSADTNTLEIKAVVSFTETVVHLFRIKHLLVLNDNIAACNFLNQNKTKFNLTITLKNEVDLGSGFLARLQILKTSGLILDIINVYPQYTVAAHNMAAAVWSENKFNGRLPGTDADNIKRPGKKFDKRTITLGAREFSLKLVSDINFWDRVKKHNPGELLHFNGLLQDPQSSSVVPEAAGAGSTNICGGIQLSLETILEICFASPEFMLENEVSKILEAKSSSSSDTHLKLQVLQNIYDYLLEAESQLGSDAVGDYVVDCTRDGVPEAAGAGKTNICGGIQLAWETILDKCFDIDQVRQSGLKIVDVALRQGLIHPITCVLYLISPEMYPLEVNSKQAQHLLMNTKEKYPAVFESVFGDGLQLSFTFIRLMNSYSVNSNSEVQYKIAESVTGKSEDASFLNARLGVSPIYKLICANRVARNTFMSLVTRKFDNPSCATVVHFLMYCTEILAFSSHFSHLNAQRVVTENRNWKRLAADQLSVKSKSLELNVTFQLPVEGQLASHSVETDENMHCRSFRFTAGDQQRIQALRFMLIARPEFMLENEVAKILVATLSSSSSSDTRLKLQVPQNIYDYLLEVESQLGSDAVGVNVVDCIRDVVPEAAGAGKTNICGGIQLAWETILDKCLDIEQVRQSGLKVMKELIMWCSSKGGKWWKRRK